MTFKQIICEERWTAKIYATTDNGATVYGSVKHNLGEFETKALAEQALDNSEYVSTNEWNGKRWDGYYIVGAVVREMIEMGELTVDK